MKKMITLMLTTLSLSSFAYVSGEAFWSNPGSDLSVDTQTQARGCWARFHLDKTFDFKILNMIGDSSVSDIDNVLGEDIEKDINMIEVGPKAVVRLYDNEDLYDYRGQIEPGTLFDDHNDLDSIDSFEVVCL